jgi:hypothetical protein
MSRRSALLQLAIVGAAATVRPSFASPTAAVDSRLLGTWRSDRDLTMKYWRFSPDSTPETKETVANFFGHLVWRITKARFSVEFEVENIQYSRPYRVIAKDALSALVGIGPESDQDLQYIRFEQDHLYIIAGKYNFEFFTRIEA